MKRLEGDLLAYAELGHFDVIVHGCNCHCEMGAGIARAIKERFPEAYEADCLTLPGDRAKLGKLTEARVKRGEIQFTVVNGYTQFDWGGAGDLGTGVLVDYEALRLVMREVKVRYAGKRIAYPKIGGGLAKGDWGAIEAIISEELEGEDHTLVCLGGR